MGQNAKKDVIVNQESGLVHNDSVLFGRFSILQQFLFADY